MLTTLCTLAAPSRPSKSPGKVRVSTRRFQRALYRISLISVLLPEPDAPVMAMNRPSGNVTLMDLRLFSRAPRNVSVLPVPWRRPDGVLILRLPERNWPVGDLLHLRM